MQTDLFKCSYCSEPYDLDLRLPKVLISCSHCLCLKCLKITFTLYSPQRRQCPVCNISLLPLIKKPEDFPNDPNIIQLLQNKPKTKCGDCTELDRKPPLKVKQKNERENLFQDKVRKKQKTAQEMDDQLIKMQELITNQFTAMRKMLHTSQNIETGTLPETKFELIKKEEQNDYHNDNPLGKITNKLQGIFAETEETFNRILKTKRSQTNKLSAKQIPQEKIIVSIQNEEEEEVKVKMEEGLSSLKASPNENKENCLALESDNDKMEDEFSTEEQLQSQDNQKNQLIRDEIREMKKQIMQIDTESLLKLDFSDKDISETIFTHLCSEDFWNGIDKNKVFYLEVLEVNFSRSSLTDQQFIRFVQNVITHMKNLTSLLLNFAKTKISSPSIQALSDQCMKKHKLKSFVLNCSQTSIGDEGFQSLDDGLKFSLETLENIELILDSTDVEGEEFLDSLFGISQLKHLKLSFDCSRISSEIVSSVTSCLSFLGKNLESLELNFNGTEIEDKGLEKFSFSQMEKLKHFKFFLGKTFISNNFLSDFFKGLGSLAARLETFELDLHSTELDNRTFRHFCEGALSKMKNLESLKLDLSGTKIIDKSLKNIRLPVHKLQYLALNLNGNKIHDSGLKILKENNDFKDIKSFNLQVQQTDVSDEALQEFLNYVEQGYEMKALPPLNKDFVDVENHSSKESNSKIGKKGFIPKELDSKRKVFLKLKKQLAIHYGSKAADSSKLSSLYVSELIERLEPKAYHHIMMKTLTKTLPIEKITATEIERWKEIIQTMIKSSLLNMNIDKNPRNSNNRRKENPHVTKHNDDKNHELSEFVLSFQWFQKYGQEISFREKVIEILKSMETRTFSVLYQKLLDFIQELSKTYRNWRMPDKLKISTFSINWWHRYIREDQELIKLWKNLPYL